MYYFHSLNPVRFRLDCFAFHKKIIGQKPEVEETCQVIWVKLNHRNFALSVNPDLNQLCITEISGHIKSHQLWSSKPSQLSWINPKTSQLFNINCSKPIKLFSQRYDYLINQNVLGETLYYDKNTFLLNEKEVNLIIKQNELDKMLSDQSYYPHIDIISSHYQPKHSIIISGWKMETVKYKFRKEGVSNLMLQMPYNLIEEERKSKKRDITLPKYYLINSIPIQID